MLPLLLPLQLQVLLVRGCLLLPRRGAPAAAGRG